jgi:hypothetical protein
MPRAAHEHTKAAAAAAALHATDLLVTPPVVDAWQNRTRVEWDHGSMTVVSREGLVKLKSFRASGTDLDDIRRLQEDS